MIERDRLYLEHIKKRVSQILNFTKNGEQEFHNNEQVQLAVKAAFQEIGESIARLSDGLKNKYTHIPWQEVKDFRNVIVHDYLGLDYVKIWDIIENELPIFENDLSKIN